MDLLKQMRERREALKAELLAILTEAENAEGGARSLTPEEDATYSLKAEELRKHDARIQELQEVEEREAAANAHPSTRKATAQVTEPPVYAKDRNDTSYFRDLYQASHKADRSAAERLRRSYAMEQETRALGNTGGAGGSGGEFAPPLWLVNEFVRLARPGRVAADLFTKQELPSGISTINIPRVATGTTVAVQTTQNTALSQTDMTTTSISAGVTTVGGKQVVSMQLLEQSEIPFDQVILQDLALAYAGQLDVQALTGAGTSGSLRGLASASGLTVQTYTQATPAVSGAGGLYSNIQQAVAKVYSTRYLAPDTILMHPRRWAWICAAFDTTNRPLVVPRSVAMNPVATDDTNSPQGLVGEIGGLEVFTDPNLPTNLGGGTNQDPIYVFRRGDIMLWESGPTAETFTQPYADSMGVLFRLYAYSALIPDRYGSSIVQINGTGTVTPTF